MGSAFPPVPKGILFWDIIAKSIRIFFISPLIVLSVFCQPCCLFWCSDSCTVTMSTRRFTSDPTCHVITYSIIIFFTENFFRLCLALFESSRVQQKFYPLRKNWIDKKLLDISFWNLVKNFANLSLFISNKNVLFFQPHIRSTFGARLF